MHQNDARCRDGDISRVSLKYDAAECSPGLVSMEWYPSLIVTGRRRMFTSVGEHGTVPLLVPGVFLPVVFSMQAHMFFRDTWHHPYISCCFCGKRFYSPCFFAFSGMQAALWHMQPCTESMGRGCADNYIYCICPLMLCIILSCVYYYYYVNLGC